MPHSYLRSIQVIRALKILILLEPSQYGMSIERLRAELVESYQQNDVPVYKIVVNGTNRSASFGTALAREDKAWLAKTINDFLDADSMATDDA